MDFTLYTVPKPPFPSLLTGLKLLVAADTARRLKIGKSGDSLLSISSFSSNVEKNPFFSTVVQQNNKRSHVIYLFHMSTFIPRTSDIRYKLGLKKAVNCTLQIFKQASLFLYLLFSFFFLATNRKI